MVRAIMDHMTALAQAFQVALPVVARIMIEVRRRQDDTGLAAAVSVAATSALAMPSRRQAGATASRPRWKANAPAAS
jgi:hypothetical protein